MRHVDCNHALAAVTELYAELKDQEAAQPPPTETPPSGDHPVAANVRSDEVEKDVSGQPGYMTAVYIAVAVIGLCLLVTVVVIVVKRRQSPPAAPAPAAAGKRGRRGADISSFHIFRATATHHFIEICYGLFA